MAKQDDTASAELLDLGEFDLEADDLPTGASADESNDLAEADELAAQEAPPAPTAEAPAAPVPDAADAGTVVPAEGDASEVDQAREALLQRLRSAEGRLRRDPDNAVLARQVAQLSNTFDALSAQPPAAPAAAPASAAAEAPVIPDGFSAETWEVYQRDFPDEAAELLAEMEPTPAAQAAPVSLDAQAEQLQEHARARKEFESVIVAAHPDFYDIEHDVVAWARSLENPLERKGAELIITKGQQPEIIELISQFKKHKAQPARPTAGRSVRTTAAKPTVSAGQADDFDAGWNTPSQY